MRLLLLIFICCINLYAAFGQTPGQVTEIPGKIVFKLKPEFSALTNQDIHKQEKLATIFQTIQAESVKPKFPARSQQENINRQENKPGAVNLSLIYQIEYNPQFSFQKVRRMLLETGLLEYVEPLRSYPPLYRPNDPFTDSLATTTQYYLKNIRAYRAWDFEQGDTSIVIGILDTGIRYTHTDLKTNLKYNYADPIDGIDNDNDGYIDNFRGWDMADNDNNATPSSTGGHGVNVAGVASGTANNSQGIVGVGFKCKFLPVKIYATTATGTFAGYEAIVYAADHGCSIINLSWGGEASPSLYEQDLINYATFNKNVVIVAAAGNTKAKLDYYPASYNNVLSVAMLNNLNEIATNTTYSYKVDISAPGINILTTGNGNDNAYVSVGGSSFSSPMVAGAAALVKHKFPQYNSLQIAEKVRTEANAAKIYSLTANAAYSGMLGKGLLDVARAVANTSAKSVRYTSLAYNNKGLAYAGDTLKITATFTNYLDPLSNLQVSVSSASPYLTVTQGNFPAGSMATLATVSNTVPFKIKVADNTPVDQKVAIRFDFTDGTYTDYQYLELIVNPDYVTFDENKVTLSVNSTGNFGFNGQNYEQGTGMKYKRLNLLSEGGLLVGTSSSAVSDNIRNAATNHPADNNFMSQTAIRFVNNPPYANVLASGQMQDKYPTTGMAGVNVAYKAYAWSSAPADKFVILEYTLKNLRTDTLKNLYAGLFADWDILSYDKNMTSWDAANKMGYTFHAKYDTVFAAIKLLSSGMAQYYALNLTNAPTGTVNATDGFSDPEKYTTLSSGTTNNQAGVGSGADVAQVVSAALPDLAPSAQTTIAFAILGGENLTDLQTSAQIAQTKYNNLHPPTTPQPLPVSLLNFQVKKESNNQVQLRWQTASETNNAYFVIERSQNSRDFEAIGSVAGKGNSTQLIQYVFTDKSPLKEMNYYRLRQVDLDGTFSFSEVKAVNLEKETPVSLQVYPNPFRNELTLDLKLTEKKQITFELFDGLGRLVISPFAETVSAGSKKLKYTVPSQLPAGIYFYQFKAEAFQKSGKLVLVR